MPDGFQIDPTTEAALAGHGLGGTLLRAIFGEADYNVLHRTQGRATFVREHRADFEQGLDDILAMHANPDAVFGPQELRVATSAEGFLQNLTPDRVERLAILLALALERLATLDRQAQAAARDASLHQATPNPGVPRA